MSLKDFDMTVSRNRIGSIFFRNAMGNATLRTRDEKIVFDMSFWQDIRGHNKHDLLVMKDLLDTILKQLEMIQMGDCGIDTLDDVWGIVSLRNKQS